MTPGVIRWASVLLWVTPLALGPGVEPALAQEAADEAAPRPIGLQDILDWKRIGGGTLTNDGRWFAYHLSPTEGNSEVVIRSTTDETEHRFPVGEVSGGGFGGGGSLSFSEDSKWMAFTVYPPADEGKRSGNQRRPARNKVGILDLASGEMTEVEDVRAFAFAGDRGGWIALHRYPAEGGGSGGASGGARQGAGAPGSAGGGNTPDRPRGTDLILRELSSGLQQNLGNVAEFAFDESGRWLAWAVDAAGKAGNGIQLRDMATGVTRVLESDEARYSRISWADDQAALSSLKAAEDEDWEDDLHSVVGWKGFENGSGPEKTVFDPAAHDGFPEGMTVSPSYTPRWSDELDAVFFGIHEVKMTEEATATGEEGGQEGEGAQQEGERPEGPAAREDDEIGDDEKPDLVLWHWEDPRLQAMQQVQAARDRNFSYLAVYWTDRDRFVRLADDDVDAVTPASKGPWAVGYDDDPYELMGNLDGRRYRDVYAIDMRTGERTMILERSRWSYSISPDGSHYVYYDGGHFHTYEFGSGEHRNVTADVPTSFVDTEDDHNIADPPIFPRGWTEDGRNLLLYDNWDLWRVGVHGGGGTNLTVNGRTDQIRYGSPLQFDPDEEDGFDLSDPVYFRMYGEWTKKSGYGLLAGGRPGVDVLAFEDASYGALRKAKDADVYVVSRSTATDYPNHHVTDARLRAPRQITDGFPEQSRYLWTEGSMLLDYRSDKGDRLQGALFLPAGYEEGRSYPTIVYIYERLSQGLNSYPFPSANGFNAAVYTSNGYAVLMPDIAYQVNDPGMSAVWSVLPALDAAIATGVVDPERVGIHGHSWGGYQTAFLITQTDAFAAAVAGAPLTNMISMYASIYWNSGSADGAIFESSQGRFEGGPWDHIEAYTRNSPVYFAESVTTPVLLLHNDEDGAVDWNQGIEYFNTLRRLGKPIVMLQYVGENHGLRKPANRKDYTVRQKEFWDHFLRGEPAPAWWTEGVPHLDMEDHIKERIHLVRPPNKKGGNEERGTRGGR
jgi:dipeptidyl aminopeptidase/acylaminoacyl peptidase